VNRRPLSHRLAATVLPGLLWLATTAQAAPPQYTLLDVTPAGSTACIPTGLNASGQVVGAAFFDPSLMHARGFVTGPDGVGTTLVNRMGKDSTFLVDIDDAGDAVGFATPATGGQTAIAVAAGTSRPVALSGLGGTTTAPSAMNNAGQIVGYADLADGTLVGYYTRSRKPTKPVAMASNARPWDIADDGTIVGAWLSSDMSTTLAFVTGRNGQGLTLLGTLGGPSAQASGVNRHQEVVGWSLLADGVTFHGFITAPGGGAMRDLGVPGAVVVPNRVNDDGLSVGYAMATSMDASWPFLADRDGHAWNLIDLLPAGVGGALASAQDINGRGQVAAMSSDMRCYLLVPVAESHRQP